MDVNGGGGHPPQPVPQDPPADAGDLALDANAKKIRNLNKKVSSARTVRVPVADLGVHTNS